MAKQLTAEQSDLAVNFYDVANDHPKLNFVEVSKKVLGLKGFGKNESFKRECRKYFGLARKK